MLEIFQFIAICLACFSLGFSLSNFLNQRIHRSANEIIDLQKEEIKKYQKCIEHFTFTYDINGIKAEAIKEFAERLKQNRHKDFYIIRSKTINDLVKEMVGDAE